MRNILLDSLQRGEERTRKRPARRKSLTINAGGKSRSHIHSADHMSGIDMKSTPYRSIGRSALRVMTAFVLCWNIVVVSGHVEWAIENGGYLHPGLEYRNEGMYATIDIKMGEVLASIPSSLELKCDGCLDWEMVNVMNKEKEGFWKPYLQSLPTHCTNNACVEPNLSTLTVMGYNTVKLNHPQLIDNITSVAQSRRWDTGMRPLLDLFNHHASSRGPDLVNDTDRYTLVSTTAISAGGQAYLNYGHKSVFKMYLQYGFIPDSEPSCEDMHLLRIGNAVARTACIAYSKKYNITIGHMVDEMNEAIVQNDMVLIKGAAQYIDRNINLLVDETSD